jgi:hypothetical protein
MGRTHLSFLGFLCFTLTGCVEGEMTYTVNPNGSAKIHFDVVTVAPPEFGVSPGSGLPKPQTPNDKLKKAIRGLLESPNVVAWKDVAAEWTQHGKLKFVGTAYVRQLSDFSKQNNSLLLLSPKLGIEKTPEGGMKLTRTTDSDSSKSDPTKRKPKTPEEIKALTDEQLDQDILLDLIEMQSAKSLLTAMLADSKLKTTFHFPGDVTEVKGFTRDGKKASYTLDGNKMLGELSKLLNEDRAALRKAYRAATAPDVFKSRVIGDVGEGFAIVAKPGEPLFDFDKEVKEAREAYPTLRNKLGLGDDVRLPTGDPPSKR